MKRDGIWFFFIAVFAVTWGLGAAYFLLPHAFVALFGPPTGTNWAFRIAVYAPGYVAILSAALFAGRNGLTDLFARLLRWRVGLQWYALATFGIAALCIAPRFVTGTMRLADFDVTSRAHWSAWIWVGVSAFWLDPGPLGEELGWRGFALPRLEQRMSGQRSALLLGTIWGIWHLPAFFVSGLPQHSLSLWVFMIAIVSDGVLVAWIVNNARGSVIPAILVHWTSNRLLALDPVTGPYTAAFFAAAALIVLGLAGPSLGAAKMPPPPGSRPA
jgi:uncharacterized protein